LAPDEELEEELEEVVEEFSGAPVVSLEDLAPEEPVAEEEAVAEVAELVPDEAVMSLDELAPEEPAAEEVAGGAEEEAVAEVEALAPEEPLPTRTLADLYARQGLIERALVVYRQLLEVTPGDEGLRSRILELETSLEGEAAEDAGPIAIGEEAVADVTEAAEEAEAGEEEAGTSLGERAPEEPGGEAAVVAEEAAVTDSAWHPESHAEVHDVDTPFAWTGGEEEPEEGENGGPTVGEYFSRILNWTLTEEAGPGDERGLGDGA
ncbi:MAG: hypothetical protein ACE5GJ_04715, partial [Gemmatimonadota bacterium]